MLTLVPLKNTENTGTSLSDADLPWRAGGYWPGCGSEPDSDQKAPGTRPHSSPPSACSPPPCSSGSSPSRRSGEIQESQKMRRISVLVLTGTGDMCPVLLLLEHRLFDSRFLINTN